MSAQSPDWKVETPLLTPLPHVSSGGKALGLQRVGAQGLILAV